MQQFHEKEKENENENTGINERKKEGIIMKRIQPELYIIYSPRKKKNGYVRRNNGTK